MKNVKVFIDAGHGGSDSGASGFGYKEKDLTLKFSLLLRDKLLANGGFEVGMSRTTDVYVDLDSRGRMMKGYDVGISNHLNAGEGLGYEFIVPMKETAAGFESNLDKLLSELAKNTRSMRCYSKDYNTGKKYARSFNGNKFAQSYNLLDYYSINRQAWVVGTSADIIEWAFIDNKEDITNFINKMDEFAEATVKALCTSYGVVYKKNDTKPVEPSKPTEKGLEPYSGFVEVIYGGADGIDLHSKPTFSGSVSGNVKKGEVLTVVGRIKVDGVYMYKTKAGHYITSAKEYVSYRTTLHGNSGSNKPAQALTPIQVEAQKLGLKVGNKDTVKKGFYISEHATIYGGASYGVKIPKSILKATTFYSCGGVRFDKGEYWTLANEIASWVKVSETIVK